MNEINTKTVTLKEASNLLGVSDATVRNWVKSGYLNTPTSNSFKLEEINRLRKDFEDGTSERLSSRANKRNSTTQFIPDEYISESTVTQALEDVLDTYTNKELEKNKTLYAISLLLLENAGLASLKENYQVDETKTSQNILKVLNDWSPTNSLNFTEKYTELRKVNLPTDCDFLGLVYQSLIEEGAKAQAGSYYTPRTLVEKIVEDTVSANDYVLDPCCGTGQFLITASKKLSKPERIWGFDIDLQAVNIA